MASVVYFLCAATSLVCAVLLVRAYRASRTPLLLWSSLCFVGLSLNNLLLFVDLVVLPTSIDLSLARAASGFVSVAVLLFGLVWSER